MENHIKKIIIEYIKKNIGNYTDIQISNYSGKVTGILNYPNSKQPRKRVFIGWDNEFLAYIKESQLELWQEYKIAQSMKRYEKNQFQLYLDETGWEEWMEQFVPSDGDLTESEIKKIEKIQKDIWSEVFAK